MLTFLLSFLRSQPTEIKHLLERIAIAREECPLLLRHLSDPLLDSLRSTIRRKWKQPDIHGYIATSREGHSPDSFIYNFIVHSTANRLESGQHHVYRGVLGIGGMELRSLFEHAINTMTERGEYTREWADEHLRKPVYEGIKRVG